MMKPSSRVSRHRRCGPERQRREHEAELTEILQHRPQADRISELGSLFTHKSRRSPFPRTTSFILKLLILQLENPQRINLLLTRNGGGQHHG